MSQPTISPTPARSSMRVTAMPAAPSPTMPTRRSSMRLPVILSALKSAAITTTAVPCWSSWKTGMSSSSFRRSSISKQRGEEMSSRLMPPNAGRDRSHRGDDLVGIGGVEADREGVDVGELLEQHRLALHHGQRRLRADVAEAQHRRAVGHDGDVVLLDRVAERLLGVVVDREADPRDARRVGHREVVAGLQAVLVALADLAAEVQAGRCGPGPRSARRPRPP